MLLSEASHRTHEFYRMRARITERLIREKNLAAVAVEADRAGAYRVNQYVRGASHNATAGDLDLYSLHRSIRLMLAYLDKVDPEAAGLPAARRRVRPALRPRCRR